MNARSLMVRSALKTRLLGTWRGEAVPPRPPKDPLIGHLRRFGRDPLGFLLETRRICGDVARLELGRIDAYLFSHPDAAKHVLLEQHKIYDKQTPGFDLLRQTFGNGILTSEGSFWLRQRRIMQPAFHKQRLAGFGERMERAASALAASWGEKTKGGATASFDLADEMSRLTLRIVSDTLFSADVEEEALKVASSIAVMQDAFNARLYDIFKVPDALPTPKNLRYRRAIDSLRGVVLGIIKKRRRAGAAGHEDLLTMLMEARDEETGEGMSDAQLGDEVLTLFVAGHETTANALAWTFFLLSRHPDARRRLEEELASAVGGRTVTTDVLAKLPYTKRVLMESMRLYPPAYITARRATTADTVGGFHIPQGSLCFVSPYVTHRHPGFWENPEGFDPDRFLPEATQQRSPWAYIPFGGGPHLCIGNGFAMMEAQIILATLASRFRLDLVPGHSVIPECVVTLRPKHGIAVTAKSIAVS